MKLAYNSRNASVALIGMSEWLRLFFDDVQVDSPHVHNVVVWVLV